MVIFIYIAWILIIPYCWGSSGPPNQKQVGGYQYQGTQTTQQGATEYSFGNDLYLNLSVKNNVSMQVQFDSALEARYTHLNIQNDLPVALNMQINASFYSVPGNQLTKKGKTNSQSSESPTNPPSNPKNPHYSQILSDQLPLSLLQTTSTSDADTYDVQYTYNTYFVLNFTGNYSSFQIANPLSETYGLDPAKTYAWIIFDETSESWFILDSLQDSTLISTTINETEFATSVLILSIIEIITPSLWATPIGIVIIIIGLVSVVFGLLMSKEEYRSYLLNRFLPIEKGPHRLTMEDIVENENRKKILDLILEQPGIHFNELLRQVGISAGNLAWHLDLLETFKAIQKQRVGQYLVYYPYLEKNPLNHLDLKLQKSKTTMGILQMINDNPGMHQNQIAKRMDLDHKTVKYHLDKLLEADVIEMKEIDRRKGFFPKISIPDNPEEN